MGPHCKNAALTVADILDGNVQKLKEPTLFTNGLVLELSAIHSKNSCSADTLAQWIYALAPDENFVKYVKPQTLRPALKRLKETKQNKQKKRGKKKITWDD